MLVFAIFSKLLMVSDITIQNTTLLEFIKLFKKKTK